MFQELTVQEIKDCLRRGKYTRLGGDPQYFLTADGGALEFQTVKENWREILSAIKNEDDDQWRVVYVDVNWEDNNLYDAHTGEKIEPAYEE